MKNVCEISSLADGGSMFIAALRKFSLASLAVLLLASCNNSMSWKSSLLPSNGGSEIQSSKLDYATVNAQVLKPMCIQCHSNANGNSGSVNLETYANVSKNLTQIKTAILNGSMPASGPALTADERNLILNWIDIGAPESESAPSPAPSPSPTPAPAPQPQPQPAPVPQPAPAPAPAPMPAPVPAPAPNPNLNFNTVYTQVLKPKCIGCHSVYSDYSVVRADSFAIRSRVQSGAMPKGSTLTSQQKSTLINWIDAGTPE